MINYQLKLPDDFEEYAWEVESKGWFQALAEFDGVRYQITFYDQARLTQDIDDELEDEPIFFESNLLVLESVDRSHMEKAIEYLANSGKYKGMMQE
ncbi:hypothetical protein FKG94_04695 [Exilibacterium tricleocarpae]|uniref:Uncharacterized protein n=1 Tax=Exilibacterium tricleocarpae TaxID=2591008 RepID=A0A545U5S7_9GAMM|nr:hypothetical protein [Exilibacterium tricleocarpae]TQV84817.1 hypothetical protein FKG94_04695 [Exilibacterium tricleocarpae]